MKSRQEIMREYLHYYNSESDRKELLDLEVLLDIRDQLEVIKENTNNRITMNPQTGTGLYPINMNE